MTTIQLSLVACHDDVLLALLGHVQPDVRHKARTELYRRGYSDQDAGKPLDSKRSGL